jgi:hypothetical protein
MSAILWLCGTPALSQWQIDTLVQATAGVRQPSTSAEAEVEPVQGMQAESWAIASEPIGFQGLGGGSGRIVGF